MKNTAIIIPTRLGAKRFPNKPLEKINNVPMIVHVLNRAKESKVGEVCIATPDEEIVKMSEFKFEGKKDDLVLNHCKKLNGNAVVFGKHGKDYVNIEKFNEEKILVYFQNFKHPVYGQNYRGFEPNLSILDLLLNHGSTRSIEIIKKDNITIDELKRSNDWINYKQINQ